MKPATINHDIQVPSNSIRYLGLRSSSGLTTTHTKVIEESSSAGRYYTKETPLISCPTFQALPKPFAKKVIYTFRIEVQNKTNKVLKMKLKPGKFTIVKPGSTVSLVEQKEGGTLIVEYLKGTKFELSGSRVTASVSAYHLGESKLNINVLTPSNYFHLTSGLCNTRYLGKILTNKAVMHCKTEVVKD